MEPKWWRLIREYVIADDKQDEIADAVSHALKAARQEARRKELERIARYVESMDLGYEHSETHTTTTIAEAIRAMPEEEQDEPN
jgi:hypothetical protein